MTKRITPNHALLRTGTRRAFRGGPSTESFAAGVFNAKCQVPAAEVDGCNPCPWEKLLPMCLNIHDDRLRPLRGRQEIIASTARRCRYARPPATVWQAFSLHGQRISGADWRSASRFCQSRRMCHSLAFAAEKRESGNREIGKAKTLTDLRLRFLAFSLFAFPLFVSSRNRVRKQPDFGDLADAATATETGFTEPGKSQTAAASGARRDGKFQWLKRNGFGEQRVDLETIAGNEAD